MKLQILMGHAHGFIEEIGNLVHEFILGQATKPRNMKL